MVNLYKHLRLSGILAFLLVITIKTSAQYCQADGAGTCTSSINNVKLSNLNKNSRDADCIDSAAYVYYQSDTVFLQTGQTTPYVISVTLARYANAVVTAWIDWNRDGTFSTGADEQTSLAFSTTTFGVFKYNGTINIPDGATVGTTRLRIRGSGAAVPNPCGTGGYEVEDYPLVYSNDSPPVTTSGTYCYATGNCGGTNGYEITRFEITGESGTSINNPSGCDGYADFTNLNATVAPGISYTAKITAEQNMYYSVASVFIDWDNNFEFTETEEYPAIKDASFSFFTATITPPDTMESGFKRMRIRNTLLLEEPLPCGSQANGEAEDYTLLYLNPSSPLLTCIPAATFSPADNSPDICQNARLSWGSSAGATGYRVTLKEGNTALINQYPTTSNALSVGPLKLSTAYQWIVVPYNANGDAMGCDTLTFTTGANSDPLAAITPSQDTIEACLFKSIQFDGNPTLGTAPYNHSWNGINSANSFLSDTASQAPLFEAPLGLYKFIYQVVDKNGCTGTDTVDVRVNPAPQAGAIQVFDNTLCAGDSTSMSFSASSGAIITWEDSTITQAWQATSDVVGGPANSYYLPSLDETVYYRATATFPASGCSVTTLPVEIAVYPLPVVPAVMITPNSVNCEGDTVILFIPTSDIVVWNDASATKGNTLHVTTSGNYIAAVTSAEGCSENSQPQSVIFNNLPVKPVVAVVANDPLCEGDQVLLTSNYSTGNTWSTGSTAESITVTSSGSYAVTQTDANGCGSASDMVVLSFGAKPELPVISQSDSVLTTSAAGASYQWFDDNGPVAGAGKQSFTPTVSGNYRVVVYSAEGCPSDTSESFAVTGVGISEQKFSDFVIYPNPADDFLYISSQFAGITEIVFYNIFGQQVMARNISPGETRIYTGMLVPGTYFLKWAGMQELMVMPIVIAR